MCRSTFRRSGLPPLAARAELEAQALELVVLVAAPEPDVEAVPAVSKLHQNVPNPFNPTTTIKFDLAHDGQVRLQIFDVAGHLVRTLVNGTLTRGYNQAVTWNGLDEGGRRVPSGVYFYQLVTDDLTATNKMVMLK